MFYQLQLTRRIITPHIPASLITVTASRWFWKVAEMRRVLYIQK
jgi:hypothetical protein